MESALLINRLVLAGVFGVAGIAKLFDRDGTRRSAVDFGVPAAAAGVFAITLPILEILIALSLVFVQVSWFGALGAAALLACFSIGMLIRMAKGEAPDCHCFGQLHSQPVGVKSLVRNIVLFILALNLVVFGRGEQGIDVTQMDSGLFQTLAALIGFGLLTAIIVFLGKLSAQQREVLTRLEMLEVLGRDGGTVKRDEAGSPHDGLPIGAFLPSFALRDDGDELVLTDTIGIGRPALLFFVSPSCTPCKAVVPKINEWADELREKLDVVYVSSGSVEDNEAVFGESGQRAFLRQNSREFADAMNAKWTPSAVFVDRNGKIASHVAAGDNAIAELVEMVRSADVEEPFVHFTLGNGPNAHRHFEVGSEVPDFEIKSIDGETVSKSGLGGQNALITFWSPTCPHCKHIAEELRTWDSSKGDDEPRLVLFSDGEVEVHRELGIKSPIVIDKDYTIAGKIGMHGTPSAILIDEHGRYASEIAIGAPNIWALLGRKPEVSTNK